MSYSKQVATKYEKYKLEDRRLIKLCESPHFNTSEVPKRIEKLKIKEDELTQSLQASGDLLQFILNIEEGVNLQRKYLLMVENEKASISLADRIFGNADIKKLSNKKNVKKLIQVMSSHKGSVSKDAFDALVSFGPEIINQLLDCCDCLFKDSDKLFSILLVLDTMGTGIVDKLLTVFKGTNHSNIEVATFALGLLNDPRAGETLKTLIKNESHNLWLARIIAAKYIIKYPDSTSEKTLLKLLNVIDLVVFHKGVNVIAYSLGKIGSEKSKKRLIGILKQNPNAIEMDDISIDYIKNAIVEIENRERRDSSKTASTVMDDKELQTGGFGEPYCSKECLDKGGEYISSIMLKEQKGVCGFCQCNVQASMYDTSNCAVIPYEGENLFICLNCVSKAKTHINKYTLCCMCQKPLFT